MVRVSATDNSYAINNEGSGNVSVTIYQNIAQLPSVLAPLLIKVTEQYKPSFDPYSIQEKSPRIESKIFHNRLRHYSDDIRLQSEFMGIVEDSLDHLDNESPGAKGVILWTLNRSYKNIKRDILMDFDCDPTDFIKTQKIISDKSDLIFKSVSADVYNFDCSAFGCGRELLIAAQDLLICYGFIGCQILEEPPTNDYK
ncbi:MULTISPECIES: hypothetical protein [Enterobacter cloacae complex]|nr:MULTISPECIES: hypothetical protein [Enterobacter cloacae complex]AWR68735.1 hypothetical protein CUN65_10405 [Enterobacter hormaechei subsp. xiangfangensis]AXL99533.1 hypothetical protein DF208_10365 [Enterobacter hormaechei subsp. xiangfangensis]EHK3215951.1 hypothetical protein [Enterobacter hormaechei]EHK3221232.1 hypothetical protein [Enterobacter hormaechei]EHK3224951.1 hypothetical protein [Enterobacter hormaechei]